MRQALLFAHRWLGLTAGLIFAIASLTGAILVYQDELNALLIGPGIDTTPGVADPAAIESSARRQYPDSRIVFVQWPTSDSNVLTVRMTDGKKQQFLELDPGSGAVLRPRRTHILVTAIRRMHVSLLLGTVGRMIVTYSTIASVGSMLLGIYLWWPSVRSFAGGFRIRFSRGFYALTYDLHQTSGVIVLPLLLLMSITGVLMDSALLRAIANSAWPAPESAESSGQNKGEIDLATAVKLAETATGGGHIARVVFPALPNGVVEVWMEGGGSRSNAARTRIGLDRHSGAVLARQDLLYDSNMNDRLHFAYIGGPLIRGLYAVACLIGGGLLFTGVYVWWKRPTSVGRSGSKSAGRVPKTV